MLAIAVTFALHVAAAGGLMLGKPVAAGKGQTTLAADTGRVQLRFVSAPSASAAESVTDASSHESSSSATAKSINAPPQAVQTAPAARTAPPPLPATVVLKTESVEAATADMPWHSIDMSRPMPATEPASTPGAQAGSGDRASSSEQVHHHDHGHARARASGDSAGKTRTGQQDNAALAGGIEADWTRSVMRRLEKFRTYPAAARHHRAEGVVMVQALIGADGKVLETRLRASCGNADLDAEALATFARARTLPAPPAHLPSPLRVDLPVAFTLRG